MEKKLRTIIIINIFLPILTFIVLLFLLANIDTKGINIVEVNDIRYEAENLLKKNKQDLQAEDFRGPLVLEKTEDENSYAIIDREQNILLLYNWKDFKSIALELENHALAFPLENEENISVLLKNPSIAAVQARYTRLFLIVSLLVAILSLANIRLVSHVNNRILRPFRDLQAFAKEVAAGNLNVPLRQDKGNIFGAFTESFDILREELRDSRLAEAEAMESKQELLAQLSHDIRTPLASIDAKTELILIYSKDEKIRKEAEIILKKSKQIESLISQLFDHSMAAIQNIMEEYIESYSSDDLVELIKNSDYQDRCQISDFPPCLVNISYKDFKRVLDNILSNSYKYANTTIYVKANIQDSMLQISLRDFGPGIKDEEEEVIFTKFYRSDNVKDIQDGAGLGLFIAKNLIQQMGGEITAKNANPGLQFTLYLPLT